MIVHDCAQHSEEWETLRCGMPTASEFDKIVTSAGKPSESASAYINTLAAEKYSGKPGLAAWSGSRYSDRGKALEGQATAYYEFDRDVIVEQVGFITDDQGHAGCSPDGLVGDDGLIEVKCLKAENHIGVILSHRKSGRVPSKYFQQPQGQMLITGREWCDLVFFHPDLPLLIVRQLPNKPFQGVLGLQINSVCDKRDKVLAVLLGVRVEPKPKKEPLEKWFEELKALIAKSNDPDDVLAVHGPAAEAILQGAPDLYRILLEGAEFRRLELAGNAA